MVEPRRVPAQRPSRTLQLQPVPAADLGTTDAVCRTSKGLPLSSWADRVAAIGLHVGSAREAAAKLLEPSAYKTSPPPANLRSAAEVEEYVSRAQDATP